MVFETEIRKLRAEMRNEFNELRKLICGKNIVGNWVMENMACAMLNVKKRQIYNLRKRMKDGKPAGYLTWRKGKGKTVQYWKPDIEKYLNEITIS